MSGTTSRTQTVAPLALPTYRTSPLFSYPLPPFLISLPSVPIFPAPSGGSVPPPPNRRRFTKKFIPSTGTKILPSVVYHTLIRTAPSAPPYPQPPTSVSSSPPRSGTFLKLGTTDWGPPVSHWGNWGWGWFPSSRMTMLSRGCWWAKCTQRFFCEDVVPWHPSTGYLNRVRVSRKYTLYCSGVLSLSLLFPPSPPWGGRWSGLAAPNSVLPLPMVCEWPVRQVDSALREIYPLLDFLPIWDSLSRNLPSVGLRWPCVGGVTFPAGHAHRIPLVGPEAHAVEEAHQGVEHSLKAGALWWRKDSIIGVENRR